MFRNPRSLAPVLLAACVGCSSGVDVDEVPLGAEVQVVRDDGGLVEGRLANRTEDGVTIEVGSTNREIARDRITDLAVVEADQPMPPPPPAATYRELTVPAGTVLQLDLATPIDTGTNAAGDTVSATLSEPLMMDGTTVVPAGAAVAGRVTAVQMAGKVKGRASVALAFTEIATNGEAYPVSARFEAVAPSTTSADARTIAVPAAGGAVLGAILGGKKGAAVGAAVGGGAGTGVVLMTAGEEIRLGTGAKLSVTLAEAATVKVPIER